MTNTYLPPSPVLPAFLVITDITLGNSTIVTVSTENSYVVGQLVYFSVPSTYGTFQINGLTGKILSVSESNLIFSVAINSSQFDPFVTPSLYQEQPATLAPAGSRNIYNYTTVPFHSENGLIGN